MWPPGLSFPTSDPNFYYKHLVPKPDPTQTDVILKRWTWAGSHVCGPGAPEGRLPSSPRSAVSLHHTRFPPNYCASPFTSSPPPSARYAAWLLRLYKLLFTLCEPPPSHRPPPIPPPPPPTLKPLRLSFIYCFCGSSSRLINNTQAHSRTGKGRNLPVAFTWCAAAGKPCSPTLRSASQNGKSQQRP